jgi:hypothetical protein
MFFEDDLNEVFGRPNYTAGSTANARTFFRQIAKQNPAFRQFARDPLGRSIINTATLLARLSFEASTNSDIGGGNRSNTATRAGRLNRGSTEFAATDIVLDLLQDALTKALSSKKVTTTSAESERSKQAQKHWNSSRSDREAMLAKMVQRGMGEL